MLTNTALLLIDVQTNMFDEQMPVHKADETLANVQILLTAARLHDNVLIIFVQHDGGEGAIDEHGAEGWQLHPDLVVQDGDMVLDKRHPDAFQETLLEETLQQHGIVHLVIAGMQTDYCINATTRRAADLGYSVSLVSNAHSTLDADDKTAAEIITEHNQALKLIANVCLADEVSFKPV